MSLRVLIVDDSALVRQVASALLAHEGYEVETASDPLIAQEKMARARPDVILLDLEMPRMDGLTFLGLLMAGDPVPVVVMTASPEGAMRALEAGALSAVTKPEVGLRGFLEESRDLLLEAVRAAAEAKVSRGPRRSAAGKGVPASRRACELIAIGASTGGPQALQTLLEGVPGDLPPVAIVQHMPAAFTGAFARRLDQACPLEVVEAEEGLLLGPGMAVVARGDRHLAVQRSGSRWRVRLSAAEPVCRHRPSVDVLFESVLRAAGAAAVGVLLTGMGDDGARGLLALRKAGAFTVAQDESTSVVYGMPREAVLRGAATEVLPLPRIAAVLEQHARASAGRA